MSWPHATAIWNQHLGHPLLSAHTTVTVSTSYENGTLQCHDAERFKRRQSDSVETVWRHQGLRAGERRDCFKAIWLSMVVPVFKLCVSTKEVRSKRGSSLEGNYQDTFLIRYFPKALWCTFIDYRRFILFMVYVSAMLHLPFSAMKMVFGVWSRNHGWFLRPLSSSSEKYSLALGVLWYVQLTLTNSGMWLPPQREPPGFPVSSFLTVNLDLDHPASRKGSPQLKMNKGFILALVHPTTEIHLLDFVALTLGGFCPLHWLRTSSVSLPCYPTHVHAPRSPPTILTLRFNLWALLSQMNQTIGSQRFWVRTAAESVTDLWTPCPERCLYRCLQVLPTVFQGFTAFMKPMLRDLFLLYILYFWFELCCHLHILLLLIESV